MDMSIFMITNLFLENRNNHIDIMKVFISNFAKKYFTSLLMKLT